MPPRRLAARRIGVDDVEQVRALYAASAGRLVSQLYALTGDFGEAQDAVQEAFARALAHPDRLRRLENPEAWLRTVAVNLARSRHRRRMVFQRLLATGRLAADAAAPGLTPDHVALVAALQRLPRALREAVVLHHLVDLPVTEVAQLLNCSETAVRTRLMRGRRALAGHLRDGAALGETTTMGVPDHA
jgi:RNA polymerase sigma factor (sigma-70 family)